MYVSFKTSESEVYKIIKCELGDIKSYEWNGMRDTVKELKSNSYDWAHMSYVREYVNNTQSELKHEIRNLEMRVVKLETLLNVDK